MFWYAIVFVASIAISYVMIPKPQSQAPAGLGDVQFPTAEVGREIPVLFGTRRFDGPNVVWYGDFATTPVKARGGKK